MPTPATGNYDYKSAGFNHFMKRGFPTVDSVEEESGDESSFRVRHLSGTSITSGISKSSDGKLIVDWGQEQIIVTDGARNRVEIGKIPGTDQYGIRIYDAEGSEVVNASGEVQGIEVEELSADKITTGTLRSTTTISVGDNNIKIDGVNKQILINDGSNDRVLIGYQENGF